LISRAVPLIRKGATAVGKKILKVGKKEALRSGVNLLGDIAAGENVLESTKQRLKEGGNKFLHTLGSDLADNGIKLAKTAKRKIEQSLDASGQRGSGVKKRKQVIRKPALGAKGHTFGKAKLPYRHIFQ
jgi:hypothetical protein